MKRIFALFLSICFLVAMQIPSAALRPVQYQKVNSYQNQFADVPATSWCAQYVQTVYEYGIMGGVSDTSFNPNGTLSTAAAIAIACRLHDLYFGMNCDFSLEGFWFGGYEAYAIKAGIIPDKKTYVYDAPITRAVFAQFISNALYEADLQQINDIPDGSIPDVSSGNSYRDAACALKNAGTINSSYDTLAQMGKYIRNDPSDGSLADFFGLYAFEITNINYNAIYRLYRAGILTGNDTYGTFTPNATITRGSAAAIISRILEPSLRQKVTLTQKPASLVPVAQLVNRSSLQKKISQSELLQAYEAAKKVVEPLAHLSREAQLFGIALAVRIMTEQGVSYSMEAPHYNDPYGFFVLHTASCAGATRATGLCLNMLGISYEHINENKYTHQWARVNMNGKYWICDAFGLYCGEEEAPYKHPRVS